MTTQTLTDAEKESIERTIDITADDVARRVDSAKVSSKTGAWFVIRCDESDVEDVASAVIRDSDVTLHKVEREDGFVSAKHNELV